LTILDFCIPSATPDPCDAAAHRPPWFTKTWHALCGRYGVADIDVWPISMLLMADMVFSVADMVVADVVCGRYRRFPGYAPPKRKC